MEYDYLFTIIIKNEGIKNLLKDFDKLNQYIIIDFKDIPKSSMENVIFLSNGENILEKIKGKYIYLPHNNPQLSEEITGIVNDFFIKNTDINVVLIGDKNKIIDLSKDYRNHVTDFNQIFIKSDILDKSFVEDEFVFLNKILIDEQKIGILKTEFNIETNISKEFLIKRLCSYNKLIKYSIFKYGEVLKFIQYNICYDLSLIDKLKSFDDLFSDDEFNNFICNLKDVLDNIDNEIIMKQENLSKIFKKFLIFFKTGDFHYEIKKDKLFLKTDKYVVNGLHNHGITLDIVDIKNNNLNISGFFKSSCIPESLDFQAVVKKDNGIFKTYSSRMNIYPTTERATKSYLKIDWVFCPCFDFQIPLENHANYTIDFKLVFKENNDYFVSDINKISLSKFCNISKLSNYFTKGQYIVQFKKNRIYINDYSNTSLLKHEFESTVNIIKSKENHWMYSIFIRIIYFILYPFYKNRRIWLFADRLSIADDNAEHLFLYSICQDDNIHKYYILKKDSKDFKRMKKINRNIVPFGGLKHKILYLFAEKFISSHSGHEITNPFKDCNDQLYNGLTSIEKCFLQHGITKDDVSYWLRKYRHNFYLFVTASQYEQESILDSNYNYSHDIVKTTGFPRYDNLSNDDLKNQILFMPTWKKGIENEEDFLNSNFYLEINNLFNNERLVDLLNTKGFRIIFKPHFELLKYCHLFDLPDEICISTEESYQELFNTSKVMITDYSSVFFDFAYLKKPVIYYQYGQNHYEKGYFDYGTMGFGEIITGQIELVDKIEEYLLNDCRMEHKFINRVDKFFKYNDKNNCKRVYDELFKIK